MKPAGLIVRNAWFSGPHQVDRPQPGRQPHFCQQPDDAKAPAFPQTVIIGATSPNRNFMRLYMPA